LKYLERRCTPGLGYTFVFGATMSEGKLHNGSLHARFGHANLSST
jgi:hypothetical protein